jgi:hypothetical protein
MAKRAARPAAIAAQALHRLCWYININTALGSSKSLSNPRLISFCFFNLRRAEMNQSIAAVAAQVSDRASHHSFMSRTVGQDASPILFNNRWVR